MRRISIRDKLFTECIGEDEVLVDDDEYNMVVVNAAGISRAYYEGDYDPDRLMLPTCWSADTQVPSPMYLKSNDKLTGAWTAPTTFVGQDMVAAALAGFRSVWLSHRKVGYEKCISYASQLPLYSGKRVTEYAYASVR